MADKAANNRPACEAAPPLDQDEVDQVLAALRVLKKQVTNPVVRECLEAARSDIAHLATALDEPPAADGIIADAGGWDALDTDEDDLGDFAEEE
jgi:hypothetical protein